MAEDGQQGHFGKKRLSKLHKPIKGQTDDGACLTGHRPNYSKLSDGKKWTCNYRYQSIEQAKAVGRINKRLHGYTTRRRNPVPTALKTAPPRYSTSIDPPRAKDWHIGGPSPNPISRKNKLGRTVKIPVGMNFSQDTWPYWNNAHHLIPKGTLAKVIVAEKEPISTLIQQGLLTALYNVNHMLNMLLMPQDREVAKMLRMPRHIQLKEGDDPSISAQVFNHPEYNDMVQVGLDEIISEYADIADKADKAKAKPHDIPKVKLSKAKLEALSERLLTLVLSWGDGFSLDSHAAEVLKKVKAKILKVLGIK